MLQTNLAKKIIQEVRKLINEEIVIMDTKGYIIASTNTKRIGYFHEGAFLTVQKKDRFIITKEDETQLEGVKAGINLPICLGQNVVGVIGITGNPDEILPYAELLRKMTELLIQENFFKEEMNRQNRAMEAFIFDWLELREWDSTFYNRADLLGINLAVSRQVIMVNVKSHTNMIDFSPKWLTGEKKNDLLIHWGNDRLLLLLEATDMMNKNKLTNLLYDWKIKLEQSSNCLLTFGIGQTVEPGELKKSFLKAERALHSITEKQWIAFDEELTLEMILEDVRNETKKEFIQRTIAPIIQDVELLQTLRTLFDYNQSLKETAEQLHIHINTLHYRIKKIEELTKLNPKNTKDQTILYLSVQLLDLYTN